MRLHPLLHGYTNHKIYWLYIEKVMLMVAVCVVFTWCFYGTRAWRQDLLRTAGGSVREPACTVHSSSDVPNRAGIRGHEGGVSRRRWKARRGRGTGWVRVCTTLGRVLIRLGLGLNRCIRSIVDIASCGWQYLKLWQDFSRNTRVFYCLLKLFDTEKILYMVLYTLVNLCDCVSDPYFWEIVR